MQHANCKELILNPRKNFGGHGSWILIKCFMGKEMQMTHLLGTMHFVEQHSLQEQLLFCLQENSSSKSSSEKHFSILILFVFWQCPSCLLETYVCRRSGSTASGSPGIHLKLLQRVSRSSTSLSMVHTHTNTYTHADTNATLNIICLIKQWYQNELLRMAWKM